MTLRPDIEVEYQTAALELATAGVGDTLASYFVTRLPESTHRISWVSLDPPYPEHYAFISRAGGGLSPATRRFMSLARRHLATLQAQMTSRHLKQSADL